MYLGKVVIHYGLYLCIDLQRKHFAFANVITNMLVYKKPQAQNSRYFLVLRYFAFVMPNESPNTSKWNIALGTFALGSCFLGMSI